MMLAERTSGGIITRLAMATDRDPESGFNGVCHGILHYNPVINFALAGQP